MPMATEAKPFPDGIPVEERPLGSGSRSGRFELPQRYYDWSFIMAHFPAPTARVRELLPDARLAPVQIVPGLAVITLAAFDYRRMATLAPYGEFAVMVPVRYKPAWDPPLLPLLSPDRYKVGFWVHHLPVTTPEARAAGVEFWGLPKVVAKIEFSDVGWMRRCKLHEDGKHVVTLSSAMGETRSERRDFYAYSILNGVLLRARVETRAEYHEWNVPGQASFELGTHPIAETLRGLGMRNVAIAGLFAFTARSRLYPGAPVETPHPGAMRARRGETRE
jgi:hypothetical protein